MIANYTTYVLLLTIRDKLQWRVHTTMTRSHSFYLQYETSYMQWRVLTRFTPYNTRQLTMTRSNSFYSLQYETSYNDAFSLVLLLTIRDNLQWRVLPRFTPYNTRQVTMTRSHYNDAFSFVLLTIRDKLHAVTRSNSFYSLQYETTYNDAFSLVLLLTIRAKLQWRVLPRFTPYNTRQVTITRSHYNDAFSFVLPGRSKTLCFTTPWFYFLQNETSYNDALSSFYSLQYETS